MPAEIHDPGEDGLRAQLESSESTAFLMWLLITVSAGIIMAQDTWVSLQQPRLSTVDATAAFTKLMVIHAIWLVVTLGFLAFTWFVRPTTAWKIHMAIGILTVGWTLAVLVWAFQDVERLEVSTWRCETAPTTLITTQAFLDSCTLADTNTSIRLGGDIFLWSADDEHYWRWIVPGEGLATLQSRWPSPVVAMYLGMGGIDTELTAGSQDSVPGGNWSARFDPHESRKLHIYFIESPPTVPLQTATPDALRPLPIAKEHFNHERSKSTG